MQTKLPILFFTIGYPGSGKTTFSIRLSKKLKLNHLYADEIGVSIFKIPKFTAEERKYVYDEMDWKAENDLKDGKSVIYDANINTLKLRNHLRQIAQKSDAFAIGIWMNTPEAVAIARLKQPRRIKGLTVVRDFRGGSIDSVYTELIKKYKLPKNEKNIIIIDGNTSFTKQYEDFEKSYKKLLTNWLAVESKSQPDRLVP